MTTSRKPSSQQRRAPQTESAAPVTVSLNTPPEEPKMPLERIGDMLKRIRLERGDDLQQIAEYLCIRKSFLVALENNRYEEFPADAYVIGFLRSYAEFLGVNSKDAIDRYRNEMAGRRKKPALQIPTPISEGRTPSAVIMAVAAVAALLIYGLWYGISSSDRSTVSTPPALPSTPATDTASSTDTNTASGQPVSSIIVPPPEPVPSSSTAPAAASAVPVGSAITLPAPPPQETQIPPSVATPVSSAAPAPTQAAVPTPAPPAPAANASTVAAPAPAAPTPVVPLAHDNTHLMIRAEQSAWVLVTDSKGRPVYDHVMKAGDVYRVPNTPDLSLTTGNGAGIVLTLDGKDLPKLATGTSHVVRNIPLDDQHLRNLPSNSDE